MRSDIDIHQDVVEELAFDPRVNDKHVAVAVSDGIVTLRGRVSSFAEKIAAEQAVKSIPGVRGIAQDLEIELPSTHIRDDADIVNAAVNALSWRTDIPNSIQVVAQNGYVTLSGTVDWPYQKDASQAIVSHLSGVRGLTNAINVKSHVQPSDVKKQIERQLQRTASEMAKNIAVETVGNRVTLRGRVHSLAEREEVVRAARHVPGVAALDDLITVAP